MTWYPVERTKPNEKKAVLVLTTDSDGDKDWFRAQLVGEQWFEIPGDRLIKNVTHWTLVLY